MARSTADLRVAHALAGLEALMRGGEDMLGESQRRAPVREGTLRASGQMFFLVNGRKLDGPGAYNSARALVAQLARAGTLQTMQVGVEFTEVYAARQHEETEWQHPLGGQAKYLESVIQERGGRYVRAAQVAAARALG